MPEDEEVIEEKEEEIIDENESDNDEEKGTEDLIAKVKELEEKLSSFEPIQKKLEEEEIKKILSNVKNVKVEDLPGTTFEEKKKAAILLAKVVNEESEKREQPTEEQIRAHGIPLEPGEEIHTPEAEEEYREKIRKGDLEGTIKSPIFQEKLKKIASQIFK